MDFKKIICVTSIISTIALISCGVLNSEVVDIDGLSVAYVVKKSGVNDKSVGQLGYEGLLKSEKELGIKGQVLEGDINNPEEFEKEIKKVAERNELIIMNGSDLAELSVEVSAMFREKKIVIIGAKENETNIQDINFKDEEGGFLMGVIAGRSTKTNRIGFIALENNENTQRLLSGFIAGIKTVNKEASDNLAKGEGLLYITKEAEEEDRAYKAAQNLLDNDVDIIFEKLSTEETGVFKVAQDNGIKVIGVGTDKYEYYPEYKDVILSSMIKKIDEVVFDVINQTKKGQFKSGGQHAVMEGLESGRLDYSKSTKETVSKEIMNEVDRYKDDIIDKKIEVPKTHIEVLEYLE